MKKVILLSSLVLSCLLVFVTAGGAMDIGLKGIGGKVGLVMPEGEGNNTFGLGVVADLGTIMPQLNAEASVDYWGNSWELPYYEVSWSTITIGGTAKYHFPMGNGSFSPFAGGGLGLSIGRSKSEWKGGADWWGGQGGSMSNSDTDIAFHVVGGVDVPVGSTMKFTAEAKYTLDGYNALWLTGAILVQL